MTCCDLVESVADYLANDLRPRVRGRFETHLAACPDCVTYVRGYADTIRLARAAYAEPEDRVPVTAAS
jgi:anti-sigma factor RsiW